jgi:hypothetical protein
MVIFALSSLPLHRPAIGQGRILGDDWDSISDITRRVLVGFAYAQSVDDLYVSADSAIFVEDCTIDHAPSADTDGHESFGAAIAEIVRCFQIVCTHDDAVSNGHSFTNDTSQTDDTIFNTSAFPDPATVGEQ